MRRNDEITLTTLDGEYVYRVVSVKIVEPTDVSVLDPSPNENTLTLVTCYPFYFVGNAPKRFIVRARQVGQVGQAIRLPRRRRRMIDKRGQLTYHG